MIVELSLTTRIPVGDWLATLDRDPRLVATALDVLDKRRRQRR